jgi:NADPH-dependent 2,4-dienoyl-CoA reductase/sulfur reductase-like enzyme
MRADVVVVALGATPDTGWLRDTGLDIHQGVLTDASLTVVDRTGRSLEGIVAVGDVANVPQDLLGGAAHRVEHWTTAVAHAGIAAATLLGRPSPPPALPSFWTDQHGVQIRGLGLPGAGDTTTVVEGAVEDHHFVATRTLRGRVVGVVAVNDTAGLLRHRPQLQHAARTQEPTTGGTR